MLPLSWVWPRLLALLAPFALHLAFIRLGRHESWSRCESALRALYAKPLLRLGLAFVLLAALVHLEQGYAARWLNADANDLAEQAIIVSAVPDPVLGVHSPELLRHVPYQINPYMPLTYGVYSLFQDPSAMNVRLARHFNFFALNLALLALYFLALRITRSKIAALFCCVLVAAWGPVRVLGIQARPDMLAWPFICLAVALATSSSRRADAYPLAIVVASAFKIMIWSTLPVLFAFDLLARNRRRFFAWVAAGVILLAALAWYNHYTAGGFAQHVIAAQRNLPRLPWFEREFRESHLGNGTLFTPLVLLLFGLLLYEWLFVKSADTFARLTRAQFVFAYLVAVTLMRKWGAGNYYLETAISAALFAALVLRAISDPAVAVARRAVLLVTLGAVFALALQNDFPTQMLGDVGPIREVDLLEGYQHLFEQPTDPRESELRNYFAGKLVLADTRSTVRVSNLGAQLFMNDPGCFNIEYLVGNLDAERAQAVALEIEKNVDVVVLDRPMEYWFGDPLRARGVYDERYSYFSRFEDVVRRSFTQPFIMTSRAVGGTTMHFVYPRAKRQ